MRSRVMPTVPGQASPPGVHSADDTAGEWRSRFVGLEEEVPLLGGGRRAYVNFDNAATTPPFEQVARAVNEFLPWYASVHRGTGYKSRVSSRAHDECREKLSAWLGIDPAYHTLLYTGGATDAINKVARTLRVGGNGVVLCTRMEHHSNLLPWRLLSRTDCVEVRSSDGSLDLDHLEKKLREHRGAVRLLAVTAASNVTGLTPPIYDMARLAHAHGAQILVDAAQLMAHQALKIGRADDPAHLDYVAFSAHKMYAPFGIGILVAPRAAFQSGEPESAGGGAVRMVTSDDVVWAGLPMREEAGTPNLVGAVALARAAEVLQEIGLDNVAAHEQMLRARMVKRLSALPGVRVFGEPAAAGHGHVGIVAFDAAQIPHGLLAAALGHEWGVGVRHGCFCAHPYLFRLLDMKEAGLAEYRARAAAGDHSDFPGLVRISFGLYNTAAEVDYVAGAIERLLADGPRGRYSQESASGEYTPA